VKWGKQGIGRKAVLLNILDKMIKDTIIALELI